LIEEARAERTAKVRRSAVRWGIAGVLGIGAVVLIAWIGGAFSGDDETDADAEPVLTAPVLTIPPTTPPVSYAPGDSTPADETTGKPSVVVPLETPTELIITDLEEGTGDAAENGDVVEVNYVGVRSADGVEFDNSYDRGATFPVTLGAGGVIAGWDQGLVGVKEGGVRQLDIPADLAYGDADRGIIRPGDALSFVVEVVSITPADS
jgi:peptidylprolyl isomerase